MTDVPAYEAYMRRGGGIAFQEMEEFFTRTGKASPDAKKAIRDAETGVRIDVILTGQYPGDGLPKPVRFLDPAEASQEINGVRVVSLERLDASVQPLFRQIWQEAQVVDKVHEDEPPGT